MHLICLANQIFFHIRNMNFETQSLNESGGLGHKFIWSWGQNRHWGKSEPHASQIYRKSDIILKEKVQKKY